MKNKLEARFRACGHYHFDVSFTPETITNPETLEILKEVFAAEGWGFGLYIRQTYGAKHDCYKTLDELVATIKGGRSICLRVSEDHFYTNHMYRGSAFETANSCGNCNGALCDEDPEFGISECVLSSDIIVDVYYLNEMGEEEEA